jgi:chitin synthase
MNRSLHPATPSLLSPFLAALPVDIPSSLYTALAVLRPFTSCVTPFNYSTPKYSAIAVTLGFSLAGEITAASLALSASGLDTTTGLLNIPSAPGHRAFDVFYYLLTSASTPAEREFLGLKPPSAYSLLNRSGTFDPPAYLPSADDAAAAEDFRSSLKAIGIKGSAHRSLLSTLAGLLKLGETTGLLVDEDVLQETCEDVSGLLGVEPEVLMQKCSTDEREVLIAGIYEALVDWVMMKANEAIAAEIHRMKDGDASSDSGSTGMGAKTPGTDEDNGDTVSITVIEIPRPDLGKAVALRGVFDDSLGINAEMKEDGLELIGAGSSVIKEMHNAVSDVAVDLGLSAGPAIRDREYEQERRSIVLEKVAVEAETGGFLRTILYPLDGRSESSPRRWRARFDLPLVLGSSRVWYHLALHPTDESPGNLASLASTTSAWSAGTVSKQLRAWRLPEWANRRNKNLDFTADFDIDEFCTRYARLGCQEGRDGVESWILERGWSNGEVIIGHERVWIHEGAWWEAESMLDLKPAEMYPDASSMYGLGGGAESGYPAGNLPLNNSGFFPPMEEPYGSQEKLQRRQSSMTMAKSTMGGAKSIAPTMQRTLNTMPGDYGLGAKGDDKKGYITYYDDDLGRFAGELDPEIGNPKAIQSVPISRSRRIWVGFVWALTFWIPSFVLRYVGRMKRPDVRMAWREKVVLVLLIFLLNATVIFYIVVFGRLLCPNFDKAWDEKEVGYHTGEGDFWVSIHGKVYDITKFWRLPHSDTSVPTTPADMQPFAGLNLDVYFPPPLNVACRGLVSADHVVLIPNTTAEFPNGMHTSGKRQPDPNSKLSDINWYGNRFLPRIKKYYKGDLVTDRASVSSQGEKEGRQWVIMNNKIYDLTDYFHTLELFGDNADYNFFPEEVTDLIRNNPGKDITDQWKPNNLNYTKSFGCMENMFYKGRTDFRKTAKCQVNNYILLGFTIILCAVILVKFLAALQLGSRRRPSPQDKFVICQVPAYTEGEDQLRKGLDSLTALQYDNKRKLICVICDGMIVGGGNDRPTPKIVLDILGVDPKIDPPALPFRAVGQGSEQLNYGKVYSGLYEFEGNVVPYIVVVKVGKESEQTKSKPGNRGKRDSQILLLSFLNRVHHRAPMSPLELEMFHQINNIIGVDPELYEYLLMVDADTSVKEDSLNRLVASCAHDARIAGICGETSLENEERSWWTMIQVYEYYISHHLAKSFESLFGSVTCLPGWYVPAVPLLLLVPLTPLQLFHVPTSNFR